MTPAFHIPCLRPVEAEARYRSLASGYHVPVPPPDERPFRLTFRNPDRGVVLTAEVGKAIGPDWSPVMAILPGPPTIIVCEQQRPHSFIVPPEHIIDVEMFAGEPSLAEAP